MTVQAKKNLNDYLGLLLFFDLIRCQKIKIFLTVYYKYIENDKYSKTNI